MRPETTTHLLYTQGWIVNMLVAIFVILNLTFFGLSTPSLSSNTEYKNIGMHSCRILKSSCIHTSTETRRAVAGGGAAIVIVQFQTSKITVYKSFDSTYVIVASAERERELFFLYWVAWFIVLCCYCICFPLFPLLRQAI